MQTRNEELSIEKFIEQHFSLWNWYLDTIQILDNKFLLFVIRIKISLIYLLLLNT